MKKIYVHINRASAEAIEVIQQSKTIVCAQRPVVGDNSWMGQTFSNGIFFASGNKEDRERTWVEYFDATEVVYLKNEQIKAMAYEFAERDGDNLQEAFEDGCTWDDVCEAYNLPSLEENEIVVEVAQVEEQEEKIETKIERVEIDMDRKYNLKGKILKPSSMTIEELHELVYMVENQLYSQVRDYDRDDMYRAQSEIRRREERAYLESIESEFKEYCKREVDKLHEKFKTLTGARYIQEYNWLGGYYLNSDLVWEHKFPITFYEIAKGLHELFDKLETEKHSNIA